MSERQQLLKELEHTPDSLIREILHFLRFINARPSQENSTTNRVDSSPDAKLADRSPLPLYLQFIDTINEEIPIEDDEIVPGDLSKNLDHYLYGHPKED